MFLLPQLSRRLTVVGDTQPQRHQTPLGAATNRAERPSGKATSSAEQRRKSVSRFSVFMVNCSPQCYSCSVTGMCRRFVVEGNPGWVYPIAVMAEQSSSINYRCHLRTLLTGAINKRKEKACCSEGKFSAQRATSLTVSDNPCNEC